MIKLKSPPFPLSCKEVWLHKNASAQSLPLLSRTNPGPVGGRLASAARVWLRPGIRQEPLSDMLPSYRFCSQCWVVVWVGGESGTLSGPCFHRNHTLLGLCKERGPDQSLAGMWRNHILFLIPLPHPISSCPHLPNNRLYLVEDAPSVPWSTQPVPPSKVSYFSVDSPFSSSVKIPIPLIYNTQDGTWCYIFFYC